MWTEPNSIKWGWSPMDFMSKIKPTGNAWGKGGCITYFLNHATLPMH